MAAGQENLDGAPLKFVIVDAVTGTVERASGFSSPDEMQTFVRAANFKLLAPKKARRPPLRSHRRVAQPRARRRCAKSNPATIAAESGSPGPPGRPARPDDEDDPEPPLARQCAHELCGEWFTPTSPRQRYCPNPDGGESLCSGAARARRFSQHDDGLGRRTILCSECGERLSRRTADGLCGFCREEVERELLDVELAWLSVIERVYDRWTTPSTPNRDPAHRVMSSSQLGERLDVLARIGAHRIATRGARHAEYEQLARIWRAEQRERRDATAAERERRVARWHTIQESIAFEEACDRRLPAVAQLAAHREPFMLDQSLKVAA